MTTFSRCEILGPAQNHRPITCIHTARGSMAFQPEQAENQASTGAQYWIQILSGSGRCQKYTKNRSGQQQQQRHAIHRQRTRQQSFFFDSDHHIVAGLYTNFISRRECPLMMPKQLTPQGNTATPGLAAKSARTVPDDFQIGLVRLYTYNNRLFFQHTLPPIIS